MPQQNQKDAPHIEVRDMTVAYGDNVVQHDISFDVAHGDIFIIMGDSGGGKSTIMRVLTGLKEPSKGVVLINGQDFWAADLNMREQMMRQNGILYQSGALWSSMTLLENVLLPLQQFRTNLSAAQMKEIARFKLSLVNLAGFDEYYPYEISGGMRKRAGLARAMALDPEILFFDEPSAGLDPISAKNLDDLIIEINESMKTTVVVITHELASIFAIGKNSILLDSKEKTIIARGNPKDLLEHSDDARVRNFLSRGEAGDGHNVKQPGKDTVRTEKAAAMRNEDEQTS